MIVVGLCVDRCKVDERMKIAVCIKQVPTREWQPRVNDDRTWIRDQDASFEMNEPDAYALEEALRLKEKHGGEVVVCSAGPARVAQVIREALARGADRAIHVEDDGLASADAFVTSDALASAMKSEQFDLVLTGLQSDDQGFAQVGVVLAERLGLPHATIIMEVQVDGGALRVKRELEGRLVPVGRDAAAGGADDPERHQSAPLRDAQGHHGGEEEGNPQVGGARGSGGATENRQPLRSGKGQEDADHRRLAGGSGQRTRSQAARGRAGDFMILVIAEQRDGKLNRTTWETIVAAQQLAASASLPVTVLVAGAGVASVAGELAAAQVGEVVTVEHAALEPYTPDGFTAALQDAIAQLAPTYVLLPHTYQTRDFAPKLAARMDRAILTDVTAIKPGA